MADEPRVAPPAAIPPVGEARPAGMDHALYPFRTLAEGPRIAWPQGGRIAFSVTLMLEARQTVPPPGASRDPRIVSPLGNFSPDWLTWSQHEYGNRVGIFRVLDVLDRFGVPCSVPEAEAFWADSRVKAVLNAAGRFLGLSFAGWNVIASVVTAAIALTAAFRRQ